MSFEMRYQARKACQKTPGDTFCFAELTRLRQQCFMGIPTHYLKEVFHIF